LKDSLIQFWYYITDTMDEIGGLSQEKRHRSKEAGHGSCLAGM
jgi:hypothetical protein